MGRDSWCLVRLPNYFKTTETSKVGLAKGNLTLVKQWNLENTANPGYDDQLFLTYHGNEDVWPWWTNDFHITDIEAPWGA